LKARATLGFNTAGSDKEFKLALCLIFLVRLLQGLIFGSGQKLIRAGFCNTSGNDAPVVTFLGIHCLLKRDFEKLSLVIFGEGPSVRNESLGL
jgi:hypothetical protein